jgi:predicted nucleic acid-binding protein
MKLIWFALAAAALVLGVHVFTRIQLFRLRRSGMYPPPGQATMADIERSVCSNMVCLSGLCVVTVKFTVAACAGLKIQTFFVAQFASRAACRFLEVVAEAGAVWQALRVCRDGKADFPDSLIERLANAAGCAYTATFDRGAAKTCGMRLLE